VPDLVGGTTTTLVTVPVEPGPEGEGALVVCAGTVLLG
jgi:hypothetical protein